MLFYVMCLLVLSLIGVHGQDPRKRLINPYMPDDYNLNKNEDISCSVKTCFKRSSSQDDLGPFWANRGKKDPAYLQDHLYAEEPRWVLVRNDEPFLHSRGKKDEKLVFPYRYFWKNFNGMQFVNRRNYDDGVDTPFFASRGKRLQAQDNDKQ